MPRKSLRRILSKLRSKPGCSLEDLGYGFLLGQWMYTDPIPYEDFDSSQHPLVRLLKLGLIEAYEEGKPIYYNTLRLSGPGLSNLTFWFSKRAIEIEEVLGIRLDQAAGLFGEVESAKDWPDAFVLMPFIDELRHVFDDHMRPAIESLGLTVQRADDFYTAGSIMDDIWAAIRAAKVVVADCTGRNPNVFYEIGLAHAIGTTTVLLAQSVEDIPFDLRHLRTILYEQSENGLRILEQSLQVTIANLLIDLTEDA